MSEISTSVSVYTVEYTPISILYCNHCSAWSRPKIWPTYHWNLWKNLWNGQATQHRNCLSQSNIALSESDRLWRRWIPKTGRMLQLLIFVNLWFICSLHSLPLERRMTMAVMIRNSRPVWWVTMRWKSVIIKSTLPWVSMQCCSNYPPHPFCFLWNEYLQDIYFENNLL